MPLLRGNNVLKFLENYPEKVEGWGYCAVKTA